MSVSDSLSFNLICFSSPVPLPGRLLPSSQAYLQSATPDSCHLIYLGSYVSGLSICKPSFQLGSIFVPIRTSPDLSSNCCCKPLFLLCDRLLRHICHHSYSSKCRSWIHTLRTVIPLSVVCMTTGESFEGCWDAAQICHPLHPEPNSFQLWQEDETISATMWWTAGGNIKHLTGIPHDGIPSFVIR